VLLLLLGLSLGLNLVLFERVRHYYLDLNTVRLDPAGWQSYPTEADQRQLTDPTRTTVVFYGDSRAAQWSAPKDLPQFEFINRGVGNQTSAQARLRLAAHLLPLQPDVVLIQICINDLKTIPLFPAAKTKIIAACKQNIDELVNRSTELGGTVILTTIFPLGQLPPERRPFWSPAVAVAIDEVNDYIRSLADEQVVVFYSYAVLAVDGLVSREYAYDFLHLNEAGYDALNAALVPLLESLTPE
jgi:lysophospholipase L1-like esterase